MWGMFFLCRDYWFDPYNEPFCLLILHDTLHSHAWELPNLVPYTAVLFKLLLTIIHSKRYILHYSSAYYREKGQKKSSSWAVELWYFSVLPCKTIQIKYKQIMHKCKQIMQIVHNLFIKCFLKDILNYSVEASWRCVGILDPRIQLKSPLTASVSLDILCLVVVGNVSYKELWCSSS